MTLAIWYAHNIKQISTRSASTIHRPLPSPSRSSPPRHHPSGSGLTRDDILDNITLYWVTKTAVSSSRLYWETAQIAKGGFFDPRNVTIHVAVSVFPDEIYAAPKTWAAQAYPKLIYFNKLDKGGHFAAWEQPALFSAELRAAFRSLR